MKGLKLLFAVLLVPLAFQVAFANDEIDTSRAATRRGTTATVTSNRQKPNSEQKNTSTQPTAASRIINANKTPDSGTIRERSTTKQISNRSGNVVNSTNRTTTTQQQQNKSVTARTGTVVQSRTTPSNTQSARITTRNTGSARSTLSRSGTVSRTATQNTNSGRTTSRTNNTRIARAGTNVEEIVNAITSRNFSACRDIFFECMDEFCANKDSTLKRCACSSRIHDFDKTKEQLSQVEDKLLEFSQRLLTVSMDKEDAMALNTATEGEIAYATDDTSKSKKMLDEIAKKLNASFDNNNFDQGLKAISLSLNADAAFDSVDSMMGASTATKSGTELYNAALPICREMALEICSQSDLEIAESGYQMSIAQDCSTVEKSYQTQNDQARAKIKESSALLDMSRLNIHQERNSDDILTCKTKMLEMLTDTTVCGTDMSKCLDISGKYIDPTTGQAFLTAGLAELQNLITRPAPDQTWTGTPENREFILFLESKKIYLEPAMENCQDISTYVWDAFIEDALAQIKLAQEAKLEEVSRSCTTLTTQCLDDANKTITDFDARALSIFGVKADVTVNAMCSDLQNMCTSLMTAIENKQPGEKTDWTSGMDAIVTEKSYDTILSTCREVGKNCIIQACTAISGNFGLCENIDTSINRKSIISRRACWNEVEQCIRDAGKETINAIMVQQKRTANENSGDIYHVLYNHKRDSGIITDGEMNPDSDSGKPEKPYGSYIYDWCFEDLCQHDENTNTYICDTDPLKWEICRLTEQIWGNCETYPINDDVNRNRILMNNEINPDNETLLSWFARNTNTADEAYSCRDTTCSFGLIEHDGNCVPSDYITHDNYYCPQGQFQTTGSESNCCRSQYYDTSNYEQNKGRTTTITAKTITTKTITTQVEHNLCCIYGATTTKIGKSNNYATDDLNNNAVSKICNPTISDIDDKAELVFTIGYKDYYCVGGTVNDTSSDALTCTGGKWVAIDRTNNMYYSPTLGTSNVTDLNFYYTGLQNENKSDPTKNERGWLIGEWPANTQ